MKKRTFKQFLLLVVGLIVSVTAWGKGFSPPSAPGTPQRVNIWSDGCTISFASPADDGGFPIIGYIIEAKAVNSPYWRKVISDYPPQGKIVHCSIYGLIEGQEYEFRVIACNKMGDSEPSEKSRPILIKDI